MTRSPGNEAASFPSLAAFAGMVAVFDVLALLVLYQWNSVRPWSRLDEFSGGYLLLSTLLACWHIAALARISGSAEVRRVFTALHIDQKWSTWAAVLGIAELLAFFDYGHLRLVRWLERPILQGAGLVLLLAAIFWLIYVDTYLGRNFERALEGGRLLTDGPYAAMRHPRYLGLIATRIALPLTLASVFGWLIAAGWMALIRRRIRVEEEHLRGKFGEQYVSYARGTSALAHSAFTRWFRWGRAPGQSSPGC